MGKKNPLVTKVHVNEKRWSALFATLRQLRLAAGLNEELKPWRNLMYLGNFKAVWMLILNLPQPSGL
jgi:hypothetical protein